MMAGRLPSDDAPVTARKGSWWRTAKAVAWSFFGIRRRADYARDVDQLNPIHVVIAGIIGAALFVLLLVLLVRWVISSGVAT
ncbi:MAG TPA: DUF2970 domain-containing protein [Burkholderiaceae bacterium]|nr:DUF2970 domain-containing protein [Burkholderiaceae bacterium]